MFQVLDTTLPVFLIILVGFLFGKFKKGVNLDPIVNVIFYISSPCLVFSALLKSHVQLNEFFIVVVSAITISLLLGFVSFLILKKSGRVGLSLPMSIGNTGYLGYPIALLAWGVDGLSKAVIYDNAAFILLLTLGIAVIHKGDKVKELLKAAPIYGIIFGVFFNILNTPFPATLLKPIEMIGNITIPAALIVLGYRLTEIKVSQFKTALLASFFKIFAGLIIGLIIVRLFGVTGVTKNVIILLATMPSAVMSMILTHKYKKDSDIVASVVFISTVMSLVTIPLVLFFLV